MLGSVPSPRIHLPNLKVLWQTGCNLIPFLDAPLLDEARWSSPKAGAPIRDRISYLPALTTLYMFGPFPYHLNHPPPQKLRFPKLQKIGMNNAGKVNNTLRGLLLPYTLDPIADGSEGSKPAALPYPSLQEVMLRATDTEDLQTLRDVLLGYDADSTFPRGNEKFWSEMERL
ncbi:hypothetical protein DL93DRAFT_2079281 [Clavulina sp. PMI_390]|nr:hypothetical protein DL93DRAFT_2079281 [Clavulina sp. PMI_390]